MTVAMVGRISLNSMLAPIARAISRMVERFSTSFDRWA
jgi:hypothetical protein